MNKTDKAEFRTEVLNNPGSTRTRIIAERDKPITTANARQIRWAIAMWQKAWTFNDTDAFVQTCHRTVRSLELELATGKPHCVLHLKPNCNT